MTRTAHFVKHLFNFSYKMLALLGIACYFFSEASTMKTEITEKKDPKTFGGGLRTAREMRKLSLRQVEEATGISNAYLSQLENDRIKKPSPHFLHKLAALYDIGYELLMESAGYVHRKNPDGPKTLAGAALFRQEDLTAEEEEELAEYLAFLRRKQNR